MEFRYAYPFAQVIELVTWLVVSLHFQPWIPLP